MVRLAAPAACAILLTAAIAAQTLRTRTDLVEVDVVVTDGRGKPVTGLRASDFVILEDGLPVRVEAFEAVTVPARPAAHAAVPDDHSGTSVATNDLPADGRLIVLILDDLGVRSSLAQAARTRRLATALVERLGPADHMAVLATSGRHQHQTEFTTDRTRLLATIKGIGPFESLAGDEESAIFLRSRDVMDVLTKVMKTLAALPHRRKAIALLSEGIGTPIGGYDKTGGASEMAKRFEQMVDAAHRANVAIYTFDVGDVDVEPGQIRAPSATRQNSLRSVAGQTGGRAVIQNAGHLQALDRLIAETGSYYLLAYASPHPPDGRFRRIKVTVTQPGMDVRSRNGYIASAPAEQRAELAPLEQLVTHNLASPGLPLRMAAVPVPAGKGREWPVAISLEVAAEALAGAPVIEAQVVAVSQGGTVAARDAFTLTLQPAGASAARWMRIASRLDLPPGRYHVRAALRRTDTVDGPEGSVFAMLDIPPGSKAPKPIEVGGLTLATPPGGVVRAERLADVLPVVPVAARDLPEAQVLLGALGLRLDADVDGDVRFTASIGSARGTKVLETRTRPAAEFRAGAGYVFRVPLAGRPPGPYQLIVEVAVGTRTVTRSLPFTIVL